MICSLSVLLEHAAVDVYDSVRRLIYIESLILGRLGKSNADNFKMMVVYMSAQFLGAFIASGLACLVYFDKIDWNMDPVHGTCLLATCAQTDYSNSKVHDDPIILPN